MKKYGVFKVYYPNKETNARHLKDDEGNDWYDLQPLMTNKDELKCLIDDRGLVYTLTRDGFFLDPEGHSIVIINDNRLIDDVDNYQTIGFKIHNDKLTISKGWASETLTDLRNQLLSSTDFFFNGDYDIDDEKKEMLKTYRQELRDITQMEGFPFISLPIIPSFVMKHTEHLNTLFDIWNKALTLMKTLNQIKY